MEAKEFLMIPGPTPVPDYVLSSLARHPLAHRSKEFSKILVSVTASLKKLAMAESDDVYILTSSGTGAMEAAITNTLSQGDKVLCLVCGLFGERWAKICETFGLKVERLKVESGQVVPLEELRKRLLEDKDRQIKAVTITHNETSTGVINDLKQLVLAIREHGALSIVDAVTSFAVVPISFSDWGIDVLVSGSQKALMLPPGLACIFMSQKAWKAYERSTLPKFYLNLGQYRTALENETTPYTPNVSMIVALKTSLDQILLEGISSIYTRHERMRRALRTGLVGMGLKPLVHESHASPTITAVLPPTSISVEQIRRLMNERYQLKVADGQDELKNKIFRIGHMGYVFERDILMCLAALEVCLTTLGHRCPSGIGVGSAITELTSMTSVLSK